MIPSHKIWMVVFDPQTPFRFCVNLMVISANMCGGAAKQVEKKWVQGATFEFTVIEVLQQGFSLEPYLFALGMHKITTAIRDNIQINKKWNPISIFPWFLGFACYKIPIRKMKDKETLKKKNQNQIQRTRTSFNRWNPSSTNQKKRGGKRKVDRTRRGVRWDEMEKTHRQTEHWKWSRICSSSSSLQRSKVWLSIEVLEGSKAAFLSSMAERSKP